MNDDRINILIIEDERNLAEVIASNLRDKFNVKVAYNLTEGWKFFEEEEFDVVLTDLKLPDGSGLDFLKGIKSSETGTEILIITAYGTVESAVEAMKNGAYDYILKPFRTEELILKIKKAYEKRKLINENLNLKKEVFGRYQPWNIISRSKKMLNVLNLIERLKDVTTPVLITGESGTGKELVAKTIHFSGIRKDKPFVAVNCSAIPETLFESELFGFKKGAFTGAASDKSGLIQTANGGTIFFDEIAEIPINIQAKLLRVIQDKTIMPIGSTEEKKIDIRIISATNRDIEREMKEGRFRDDLYYRINVLRIELPPLRERREDIPILVNYFLKKFVEESGKKITGISEYAMKILMEYDYPGNIRELENIINAAVAIESTDKIQCSSIRLKRDAYYERDLKLDISEGFNMDEYLNGIEKKLIIEALEKSKWRRSKAAVLLGIDERSLRYRIKKLGIE